MNLLGSFGGKLGICSAIPQIEGIAEQIKSFRLVSAFLMLYTYCQISVYPKRGI